MILWYACCGISLPRTESLLSPVKRLLRLSHSTIRAVAQLLTCTVIHCVYSFCPPLSYAWVLFSLAGVLARRPWGLPSVYIPETSEEGDNQLLPSIAISLNFLSGLTGLRVFLLAHSKLTSTADRKSYCTTKVLKYLKIWGHKLRQRHDTTGMVRLRTYSSCQNEREWINLTLTFFAVIMWYHMSVLWLCVVGASDSHSRLRRWFPSHGWLLRCDEGPVWIWGSGLCHICRRPLRIHMVRFYFSCLSNPLWPLLSSSLLS